VLIPSDESFPIRHLIPPLDSPLRQMSIIEETI
jgi:hypothetical protein